MGLTVKKNTVFGVEIEDTEGTYKAPTSATKYVQTLTDGAELAPSKELLGRNVSTASIGKTSPRTGQFQVTGSLPVEARANSVSGEAPEYDALLQSAMGGRRQISAPITTKSGNTGTVLQIEDADIAELSIGDIILVKEDGAFHVSPIFAKSATPGSASVTLLVSKSSGTFSANVEIEKSTTYIVADAGHPSLSISKYVEGSILEQAMGCRVNSMSLEGFSTGQLPSFNFAFEGVNFDSKVQAIPHSPQYDSSLPPIILDAHVYMDGLDIEVNEMSVSLENTLGFKTATSAPNGRTAGRATERTVSGSIDPYKQSDNIDTFLRYKNNTPFSLFACAKVPTSTPGEFNQIVAVYLPNCIITEKGEADQDGILKDTLSFSANRGSTGTTPEIYLAFI